MGGGGGVNIYLCVWGGGRGGGVGGWVGGGWGVLPFLGGGGGVFLQFVCLFEGVGFREVCVLYIFCCCFLSGTGPGYLLYL